MLIMISSKLWKLYHTSQEKRSIILTAIITSFGGFMPYGINDLMNSIHITFTSVGALLILLLLYRLILYSGNPFILNFFKILLMLIVGILLGYGIFNAIVEYLAVILMIISLYLLER